ncbi:MAG TPA: hypothetical protein VFC19_05675 [Candidatus Limnocylindrales bacterium]|nr:hypothetical protein [Candidatus Limnocylindrales bacterium]
MAVLRACDKGAGETEYDAAVAELESLPERIPDRGTLAAGLIEAMIRHARIPNVQRHLLTLLAIADKDPPSGPGWSQLRALARLGIFLNSMSPSNELSEEELSELEPLLSPTGDDPPCAK